ncbi:MAG TPA: NERD domain-containing protein [Roseiflexaceae bacterium]|nr:NERD domain-containing protein [Roseiflexaceae bacterium]
MAVQVWIGEKPEHPNERRAIVALANGLERLDGLYLILANFSVGGRTIDLVVIKQDAIFILELKHCDGRVFGDVNGPWFVESDNGVRKRLNSNRKNPYNQVISYYYSLTNFLKDHRSEFLSPNRASAIDFRSCRRVIVIAPTLQAGSQVDIDWKVDLRGLDELPVYLVTERSPDIELTEDEMLAIPQLLHCTRWNEINALIAGVMPAWQQTPSEVEPAAPAAAPEPEPVTPEAAPAPAPAPTLWERGQRALRTWPGRLAASFALLSLILALLLLLRPTTVVSRVPDQAATTLVSTSESGLTAGGLGAGGLPAAGGCVWSGYQSTGRRLGEGGWENVGVIGAPPAFQPQVVVTLEEVSFCEGQIRLTWSVRNKGESGDAVLPLTGANVLVRDEDNTDYLVSDAGGQPVEIRAAPGQQARGSLLIDQPVSLNAATLRVTLKKQPFGEAVWLVPVPGQF